MTRYDVVVIGGGPAGLAAAISASKDGANVCLIEREARLGGILKQCIHDGFGLVKFGEKLTGPEYAERFIEEFTELGIDKRTLSFVTNIETVDEAERAYIITLVNRGGIEYIKALAIILATGCRERTPRQVGIHGTRPSGVLTAGSAQNYINILGEQVAKKCVILGSGDIGLIMARRLTLEGAEVLGVYEVMPVPSGLARNIRQCLEDFDIPLHLSTTVTRLYGDERLEAVETAEVDYKLRPIPGTEKRIECDALIVSVGLIPENELAEKLGVTINPKTKGPDCDINYMTTVPGVFSCGNCYHVYDLVDYVTESGEAAGRAAAAYSRGELEKAQPQEVVIPPKKAVTPGKLVCIGCPKGCEMDVELVDNNIIVRGNSCPKGEAFAVAEMTDPTRVLCTTIRTSCAERPVLPVRTAGEIPKGRMFEAMKEINEHVSDSDVKIGDVIIENVAGTGVDVIAASGLTAEEETDTEPLVLTFDIGTQSIRAILARKDGSFADTVQLSYEQPYISENEFWAEQEPFFYYDKLCDVSRQIISRNRNLVPNIKCVTVTTIRDTVLCLDRNMKPIGNYIVWLDKREADFDPECIPLINRELFKAVGMLDTIEYQFRDSKCNWIMQHDPERWNNTESYVYLSGHINYLMTGRLVDSIGSVIGHMPFDYKKRRWMKKSGLTYSVYPVPEEKLFPVIEPGETVGYITRECSEASLIPEGIPVIATGSDKGCETVGLSVHKLGSAAISFGTSATIQIASDKFIEPRPFIPAYPAAIPGGFNPEIQIYRGYWMLTWFINEFCRDEKNEAAERGISVESVLNEHLGSVPPGSDGLYIQPYWSPGVATPNARGCMVGFTDRQSKYHVYRAIIEGINFELMAALKQLEKQSKTAVTELYAGGGGARSPEILQITADMFGLPVKRIQTHEASGLGSSLVGFVSIGEFDNYEKATESMVHLAETYTPDPKNHAIYAELYDLYSKMYGKLKHIYKQEKEIYRRLGSNE